MSEDESCALYCQFLLTLVRRQDTNSDVRSTQKLSVGKTVSQRNSQSLEGLVYPRRDSVGPVRIGNLHRPAIGRESSGIVAGRGVGGSCVRRWVGELYTLLEVGEPVVPCVGLVANMISPLLVCAFGTAVDDIVSAMPLHVLERQRTRTDDTTSHPVQSCHQASCRTCKTSTCLPDPVWLSVEVISIAM